jgi:hypothetical protein
MTAKPVPGLPVLQDIFFGRVSTGQYGLNGVYSGTVLQSPAPGSSDTYTAVVSLDGMDALPGTATPSWVARFEKRLSASPMNPPAGTRCIVAFPPNEADHSPWVLTFVGWP